MPGGHPVFPYVDSQGGMRYHRQWKWLIGEKPGNSSLGGSEHILLTVILDAWIDDRFGNGAGDRHSDAHVGE
jgi:hypothetical protein